MPNISDDLLLKIIQAGLNNNKERLIELFEEIAATEINKGKHNTYRKILGLLEQNLNLSNYKSSGVISEEKTSILNDLDLTVLNNNYDIWLPELIKIKIENIVEYYDLLSNDEELRNSLNKIILYGPPGTGKTTLGFYIAKKLKKNITYIKVTDVISSKFGETMKNIVSVFENSSNNVIFIDEFDAFAKTRGDTNDVGELKRIVNSLIQIIDFYSSNKIIIVATNLIESIDSAILRRFTNKIYIGNLNKDDKKSFIQYILKNNHKYNIKLNNKEIDLLSNIFDLLSIETIDEIIVFFNKAKLHSIIKKMKKIELNDLVEVLFIEDYIKEVKELKIKNKTILSKMCIIMENIGYSKTEISNLLNIHRNSYKNYISE